MAAGLTWLFFQVSWHVKSGGVWINDRVHIYTFLILLPFYSTNIHRYFRYAFIVTITILSLWHCGLTAHTYYYLDRETAEMSNVIEKIEPHSTLTVRSSVWDGLQHRSSSYIGPVQYTSPFLHVTAFYGVDNGSAFLRNLWSKGALLPGQLQREERSPGGPSRLCLGVENERTSGFTGSNGRLRPDSQW